MFCSNCGKEIDDKAIICINCGVKTPNLDLSIDKDIPSQIAGVASCFFPIVGLILFFLWKDEKPKSAKVVLIWMIPIALLLIFYIVILLIGLVVGLCSAF